MPGIGETILRKTAIINKKGKGLVNILIPGYKGRQDRKCAS